MQNIIDFSATSCQNGVEVVEMSSDFDKVFTHSKNHDNEFGRVALYSAPRNHFVSEVLTSDRAAFDSVVESMDEISIAVTDNDGFTSMAVLIGGEEL